jgi:hypothetical protein
VKKEYDFTKAKRGKFYRRHVKINLPVYLDKENAEFIQEIVAKKHSDPSAVVNDLLKGDRQIVRIVGSTRHM